MILMSTLAPEPDEPDPPEPPVPPQALSATRAPAAAQSALTCARMGISSSSESHVGDRVRPPANEAVLERGDQGLGDQGDDGQDHHRGEHAVRVERVHGGRDEKAETLDGAK